MKAGLLSIRSFVNLHLFWVVAAAIAVCFLGVVPAAEAQLSADTLDTSFDPGTGVNGFEVFSIALQNDDKVLIGGQFNNVNGVARTSFARLNANGSVDTGFAPVTYNSGNNAEGQVNSVALQSDGKILIGGVFTQVNGVARNGPTRLNTDGSLDTGYDTTANVYYVNGLVYALAAQKDGKVLVGGFNGIERTNADGSADSTFAPSSGDGSYNANGQVFAIAVQPDGKIIFGGAFTSFAGAARSQLARLNADGTLDTNFNPATNLNQSGVINGVAVQPDGKVLFAGRNYDAATGNTPGAVGRLNSDGSVDAGFDTHFAADTTVNSVTVQVNGKLLLGGRFNTVDGAAHKGIARLNADGTLDATFSAGIDSAGTLNDFVYPVVLQPDGKILLGGNFNTVNGTARREIARLLGDNPHPPFFIGEVPLSSGVYYLQFASGNPFGYYSYLADPHYIFHFDLGYEYVFDAADGKSGAYFYDFKSESFFYSSPAFPFPYLYDFSLNTVLYYYPDPSNPGHYNTNGTRYFYNFATGQIITK